MARKKSNFYHIRNKRVGINEQRAAEILGVTVEDVLRFDVEGAPAMAERLLLLWDAKNLGVEGWDGFLFSRGVLRFKNHRWTPATMLLWRDQGEEIAALRMELAKLKSWRGLSTVFVEKLVSKAK